MLDSNFKFCHNPFFIWGDQFRQQLYNMLEAIEKLINKSTNQPANNIFNIKNWEHISENDYYLNNISFSEGKIFEKIIMQFAQEKKIETHANDSYATILFDYNIYPVNPFIPALNFNYYMLNERPLNFGFALELIPMLHYKRDQHDYVNVAFQKAFTCLCEKYSHFIRYEKLLSAAKHRFYLPTRQITRGSIGLFYEILIRENDPQISYYIFNFIKDLHKTILLFYHHIIVKNIGVDWTLQDKKEQLFFRSICAEYYLFTDRNIVENMILGTCKAALLEKMPPLLVRQTI